MAAVTADVDLEEEKRKDNIALNLSYGLGFFMMGVTMILPVRSSMIMQIKKGDGAATAKAMGTMSAAAAVIELIVNPVLGKMSDDYGRKPFLCSTPLVSATLHGLVAVAPGNLAMQFIDRVISGAMIFGYIGPTMAALADIYGPRGPQRVGMASAIAGQYLGVGAAIGPFLGSKLGGAKAFFFSALAFVVSSLFVSTQIEETLAQKNRKPFKMSDINPVAFIKLFTDKTMSWLAITGGLQSFGDYVNIYDINNLFMIQVLGYGPSQIGNFATLTGISSIVGGGLSAKVMKATSLKTATLFSNFMWVLGMAMLGSAKTTQQAYAAILLWTFGHNRNNPVGAFMQTYWSRQGLGRAEIIGADGNFKAYIKIMIPLLYSNIFAWATSDGRNMPGLPYFVICGLTMLSQCAFQVAAPSEK